MLEGGGTEGLASAVGSATNNLQSSIDSINSNSVFDTSIFSVDTTNARVGIGTTSPTDTLSVNGPVYLAQVSAPSNTSNRLYNTSGDLYWAGSLIGGSSVGNWTLSGSDVYRASGNVGLSTTTPFAQLSINSEAGEPAFVVGSSTATSFIVDKSGNVGVGLTNPTSKLDVYGTSTAHSFAFSGNANTWELRGRGTDVATWGVPYFRSTITDSPTSLDVMPNGTGGSEVTGKAWIDICNSDLSPINSNDFSCLLLAAKSDNIVVGTHHGGTGTALPLSLWGSTISFALDQFSNAPVSIDSTGLRVYDSNGANQFWWFYSEGTRIKDTHVLGWSSSDIGSPDVGLARNDAGILEVNNGTRGSLAGLSVNTFTTIGNTGIGSTTPSKTLVVDGDLQVGTPTIVVGGTMTPDYSGTYTYVGVYNRHKYYQLSGVGYVWWNTSGWWEISASLGVATSDFYSFDTNRDIYPPFGSWIGRNGASGTLTTSAGTDSHLSVDGSGNLTTNGSLGIGTTSPWTKLGVNSTVSMPGLANDSTGYYVCLNTTTGQLATSTGACGASSIQYKENVEDLGYGLEDLLSLKPVSFDYKQSYIKNAPRQIGFIAEEVDPIIPEVVQRDQSGEIQGLDYPKFTALIVKAIQELNTKLDTIISVMEDGTNGLKNLVLDSLTSTTVYTREITADKINVNGDICVNNTCITKDQFEAMILKSGVGATQYTENQGGNTSPLEVEVETNSPGEVLGKETASSTEPVATSTEEIIKEETATSTPVVEEQDIASTTPISDNTEEDNTATSTDSISE